MSNEYQLQLRQAATDYLQTFQILLQQVDLNAVGRIVECLSLARDRRATIFIAGNGGSAATASHWANDLGKATKGSGREPMKVMSLTDNVPWITALANDEGYNRIFSGQMENFARPGDVLVVISASGNSANLVTAVDLARANGILTIGVLGFDGGALKNMVDEYIWLPTEKGEYGLVESAHATLGHVLTTCLAQNYSLTECGSTQKKQAYAR